MGHYTTRHTTGHTAKAEMDYFPSQKSCGSCECFVFSSSDSGIGKCTMHSQEVEDFLTGGIGRSAKRLCPLWEKRISRPTETPREEVQHVIRPPCELCGYLGGVCCPNCVKKIARAIQRGLTPDEAREYARLNRKLEGKVGGKEK